MNSAPVEEYRFADGQFPGYLTDHWQDGRWQSVEQVIGSGSRAARDLAVGRLDDRSGFADCLVPDSGVGIGQGSFGDVEPGGDRGPPLDGDGGAPALVEVADREDAVLVAWVKASWISWKNSGSRDGATAATA